MGLTCKQFGKFRGVMKKLDNRFIKQKAEKVKKEKGVKNEKTN